MYGYVDDMYANKKGHARMEIHKDLVAGRSIPRLAVVADTGRLEAEKVIGLGERDEVVLMEGVGHWMHQMKSEEFNESVGKWLGGLQAS